LVYVAFPGTSSDVNLPPEAVPEGLDWNLWLGPAPWRPFHRRFHIYGRPPRVVPWDFCRDFGGGNLTSNAVHAVDVVQWGLGMDASGPVTITPPETGEFPSLTYEYANGTLLQVAGWQLDPRKHVIPKGWDIKTRIQAFGAVFVGEEGWIHVGRQGYLQSYPADIVAGPSERPEDWHPVNNHHQDWLQAVKQRRPPACDVEIGCRSTTVSHLGCIAHWTGRKLAWNPQTEQFVNGPARTPNDTAAPARIPREGGARRLPSEIPDDDANRWLRRAMREPWRI
jgi:hypothetical protein